MTSLLVEPAARSVETRACLVDSHVGLVEDLQREGALHKTPEAHCDVFQVCLPYRGLFVWHVGAEEVVGDANQVVYVRRNEAYRMSAPLESGYAELIITPRIDMLAEVAHINGARFSDHPLFRLRTKHADPAMKATGLRFLHWARSASSKDQLERDEAVLTLLKHAFCTPSTNVRVTPASARLIRRAKEFLHRNLRERILLQDIARDVDASATYLTDLFSRVEGCALHEYLTRLRLSEALAELPHSSDLTALALELGFSSHSHFTYAFRRRFGCTPSQFRRLTKQERT